jgi:uncharacterized protein YndB with AHSA1/START domain
MPYKSRWPVTIAMLTLALALGSLARAEDIEPQFEDQSSTFDKQNQMRLEASASLNAPLAKVYDALSNPDKVAKYDPQITAIKVVSTTPNSKVVEFTGQPIAVPNAPKSIQIKFTFDPAKNAMTAQSVGKALLKFRADYTLTASKDGKSTEIHFVNVSPDPSKALGMDTLPQFMRRDTALNTFMQNLRHAGQYIQAGGK